MMQRYRELASMRPEFHRDHLDGHSGWLTARYEIVIKRDAESIWEYIYDPKTWTASNPDEHTGLLFYNEEDRPKTDVAFHQKESVAGVPADLRGHILFAKRPDICVWNGVARYRLFGFVPFFVPEAGVLRQENADAGLCYRTPCICIFQIQFLGDCCCSYLRASQSAGDISHIPSKSSCTSNDSLKRRVVIWIGTKGELCRT